MAIGFLVVDEERSCLWPWGVGDDPQVLVEPDGILGKVEQHVVPADVVGLEPSVVRGERMNRAFDVFERNVAAVGGGASRQKVVGHVRARERRFQMPDGRAVTQHAERNPLSVDSYAAGPIHRLGSRESTSGAAVRSQLSVLVPGVVELGVACLAQAGIGHLVLEESQVF